MSQPINIDNAKILSSDVEANPPVFEVVGNPDREDVQLLCRDLINYGANPMLWGDRDIPMYLVQAGNGFALVKEDGERKLINTNELGPQHQLLCLQTYRASVTPQELAIWRRCSLFLYGLQKELISLGYSPEQMESMKRKMLASFNGKKSKVKYESGTIPLNE